MLRLSRRNRFDRDGGTRAKQVGRGRVAGILEIRKPLAEAEFLCKHRSGLDGRGRRLVTPQESEKGEKNAQEEKRHREGAPRRSKGKTGLCYMAVRDCTTRA